MPGEATRFSLFSALYLSFFSRELYRDVAARWRGRAFLYLLLLMALAWVPVLLKMHLAASRFMAVQGPALLAQVPEITIENGSVSTTAIREPYVIRNPITGEGLGTIDTAGRLESPAEAAGFFLLNRHSMMVRTAGKVTEYDLSKVESFHMDRLRAERWLRFATRWGPMLLYPLFVLFWMAWCLVIALVCSVVAFGIARGFGLSLSYPAILSVAIVALTPFVLLNTLIDAVTGSEPSAGARSLSIVLYVAVTLCYLTFGLSANRDRAPEIPPLKP